MEKTPIAVALPKRDAYLLGQWGDQCGDIVIVWDHGYCSGYLAGWDEVVGAHIARVTRAKGCRGGTLFVEVAGAAWMTELNMMRRTLLERLNEDRERGRIERIVFVQSDDGSTVTPRRERKPRGRG